MDCVPAAGLPTPQAGIWWGQRWIQVIAHLQHDVSDEVLIVDSSAVLFQSDPFDIARRQGHGSLLLGAEPTDFLLGDWMEHRKLCDRCADTGHVSSLVCQHADGFPVLSLGFAMGTRSLILTFL